MNSSTVYRVDQFTCAGYVGMRAAASASLVQLLTSSAGHRSGYSVRN